MGEFWRPPPSMLAPVSASPAQMAGDHARRAEEVGPTPSSLKILHILRAPVGGLFRHVLDVARGQAERGHRVGLIADSTTGGERADAMLARLAPLMALGVKRVSIPRQLGLGDVAALRFIAHLIAELAPDVLHGHGAKGAALARLAPRSSDTIRAYTPHGGSLVYAPGTLGGGFYRTLEWLLNWRTDLFLFESDFIARQFCEKIGRPRGLIRVVRNGLADDDFTSQTPRDDATDFVCLGELRDIKGFDVLIEALAVLKQSGRSVSATIAGEGSDGPHLKELAARLGLADRVHFVGHRSAREAFAMGHIFVVPSRAESLPYVVLEAAAAGMPIVATRVGGIPEIFGAESSHLVPSDDVDVLTRALANTLDDPVQPRRLAQTLRSRVRAEFSVSAMVENGVTAYREALAARKVAQFT